MYRDQVRNNCILLPASYLPIPSSCWGSHAFSLTLSLISLTRFCTTWSWILCWLLLTYGSDSRVHSWCYNQSLDLQCQVLVNYITNLEVCHSSKFSSRFWPSGVSINLGGHGLDPSMKPSSLLPLMISMVIDFHT